MMSVFTDVPYPTKTARRNRKNVMSIFSIHVRNVTVEVWLVKRVIICDFKAMASEQLNTMLRQSLS